MTFQSPHLLWLLVPLVLLFSWELARHATQGAAATWPRIARAWAGAFAVTLGARHTTAETRPRLWLWFGLALCLIALARPQWGVVEEQVFDQSREVLVAVDLSKSMLAPDVKPTRLDRAKLLIQSLLDRLKGERVGLVLFSGSAFLQSPLSADYEILREFLPALRPDYLPEGGSNYRAMLEAAIEAFGTSTADRYLIILSDGESTEEGWKELGPRLRDKGIRVIGLGIGTAAGAFIPDEAGGFVKDERGAVVMSRLNSATLQELAQLTGGAYTDASAWVDLPALLARTVETGRKGEFSEKNTARMVERFQWFLAPGLLLLLISFWAEFPVRPRERALPLTARDRRAPRAAGATAAVALLGLAALALPAAAPAQAPAPPVDTATLAKPLSTTVTRLAAKDHLAAKDFAELARTTVTYGQRMQSAQQPPAEGAIRDALAGVDRGEKLDPRAADWPQLRRELEALLAKPEPPPEQQQDQPQQEEKSPDQQQDQRPDQQPQEQQPGDPSQQPSGEQQEKPPPSGQPQDQPSAFGDMQDQPAPPPPPKPQPSSGTQQVGGQPDQKPSGAEENPELALPLQKLDQVRGQDSPAKLYQLLQGRKEEPRPKGKDW